MSAETHGPLKRQQGKRADRMASMVSIRANERDKFIAQLRKRTYDPPDRISQLVNDDPWASLDITGLQSAKADLADLVFSQNSNLCFPALQRAISAIKSNPNTYLVFVVAESPDIMQCLKTCITISEHPSSLSIYLELVVVLAASHSSVVSLLIDSGIVNSVYTLLMQWQSVAQKEILVQALNFFCNLASGETLSQILCFNLEIPHIMLKIMENCLHDDYHNEYIQRMITVISATMVHLSRTNDYCDWDVILESHASTYSEAMVLMNQIDQTITVNLAFALSHIATFVDTYSIHKLVPIFMNSPLMASLMTLEYPEKQLLVTQTLCRLLCTNDEFARDYIISNRAIVTWINDVLHSKRTDLRMFGFNCVSNIAGSNDPGAHTFLFAQGFIEMLIATVHLDILDCQRQALCAINNILCNAEDEARSYFCIQTMFLVDVMTFLDSKDADIVLDALQIVDAMLTFVEGRKDCVVWSIFESHDLEGKLNNLFNDSESTDIVNAVGALLKFFFEYLPVDSDGEEWTAESDEGEKDYDEEPIVGQTKITDWLGMAARHQQARSQVDMDICTGFAEAQFQTSGFKF